MLLRISIKKAISFNLRSNKFFTYTIVIFIIFMLFELFSCTINNNIRELFSVLRTRFTILMMFFLMRYFLQFNGSETVFFRTFTFNAFVNAILIFLIGTGLLEYDVFRIQNYNGPGSNINEAYFQNRTPGFLNSFGDVAILYTVVFIYIVDQLKYNIKNLKNVFFNQAYRLIFLILIFSTLFVSSRNVWLAIILSLTAYFFVKEVTTKRLLIFVPVSLLVLIPIFVYSFNGFIDNLYNMRAQSIDVRFLMYAKSFLMLKGKLFFGIGPFNFAKSFGQDMHNAYLDNILRAGIGGIIFNLYLFYILYVAYKAKIKLIDRTIFPILLGFMSAMFFYPGLSFARPISFFILAYVVVKLDLINNKLNKEYIEDE